MTPNNSHDSRHGDELDKLPEDLRALEADLRLLQPRAFKPESANRLTARIPIGPFSLANAGNPTTFVAGVLCGSVLSVLVTILIMGGDRRNDPTLAQQDLQPESVERPKEYLEAPTSQVEPEETQVASFSLMGIAEFFSHSAENGDRQLAVSTFDRPLSASPDALESLLKDDLTSAKFRFARNAGAKQNSVFELQKELLRSF
jgi:hypothetical protein